MPVYDVAVCFCLSCLLQFGGPVYLRQACVFLLSLAQTTHNLPPVDAAPELWEEVGGRMG